MMGQLALFWPALRNDPAPGFARSDQHELRSGAGSQPIGQGAVLNALRGGYFTRATNRRWTPLNAYLQSFNTQSIKPGKESPRRRGRKEFLKGRKRRRRTMPPQAASRSKRRWATARSRA